MSWFRRFLLLAGLVTGAWLLGSAGQANADVKVEIDRLQVDVKLPVVDVGVRIGTGLVPDQPEAPPVPPTPKPRTDTPVAPQQTQTTQRTTTSPAPVTALEAPAEVEQPKLHTPPTTRPTNPAPVPQQPRPQAEPPITGTLPQSGAGQASGGQIPAGTLPNATRPPTTTTSLVSTEQEDVPRTVRAEEPTFSPD